MKVKIQEITFPKENICDMEELYYRKIGVPTTNEIIRDSIIFKKHQRKGYAKEGVKLALDYIVNTLNKVAVAKCYLKNEPSKQMLISAGF